MFSKKSAKRAICIQYNYKEYTIVFYQLAPQLFFGKYYTLGFLFLDGKLPLSRRFFWRKGRELFFWEKEWGKERCMFRGGAVMLLLPICRFLGTQAYSNRLLCFLWLVGRLRKLDSLEGRFRGIYFFLAKLFFTAFLIGLLGSSSFEK